MANSLMIDETIFDFFDFGLEFDDASLSDSIVTTGESAGTFINFRNAIRS
jgi:hypothetical protein